MLDRKKVLLDLLNFSKPLIDLEDDLSSMSFDFCEDLVLLKSNHISNVLKKFIHSEITIKEVEGWANLIECREDIGFFDGNQKELASIIYCLANPYLEGELTKESSFEIIALLEK